jgi:hypothetical protein
MMMTVQQQLQQQIQDNNNSKNIMAMFTIISVSIQLIIIFVTEIEIYAESFDCHGKLLCNNVIGLFLGKNKIS